MFHILPHIHKGRVIYKGIDCEIKLTVIFQKKVSGIHIGVYILPRALYTILTHSFKYLVAMLSIGENMKCKRRCRCDKCFDAKDDGDSISFWSY